MADGTAGLTADVKKQTFINTPNGVRNNGHFQQKMWKISKFTKKIIFVSVCGILSLLFNAKSKLEQCLVKLTVKRIPILTQKIQRYS